MPERDNAAKRSKNLPFETSHAFIIGCDNYRSHQANKLKTAVNDAKAVARVLEKDQKFKVYPLLLDATKSEIETLLSYMEEIVGKNDRVFFYFAGHGTATNGEDQPEGYIIPVDAGWNPKSHIPMKSLYDSLHKLKCRHLLLVLDCCFSGSFEWNTRYREGDTLLPKYIYKERFERFTREKAWQVITSSAYHQQAQDTIDGKHSPFAVALMKGLQGEADMVPRPDGDGLITGSELFLYIKETVDSQTTALNVLRRQTPRMFQFHPGDIGEFLFFHPSKTLILPQKPHKNPYKGLRAYNEKDHNLFYGRQEAVARLLKKVESDSFIVVTGASGTGKSSLVKAGLIPELRLRDYKISAVFKPGKHPLKELDKVTHRLHSLSKRDRKDSLNGSILVVDQLEELYTLCQDPEERKLFLEKLKSTLDTEPMGALKIIVTVRSDFEPQLHDIRLTDNWENSCFRVPSFTLREMREIILSPAIQAVLYIDPPQLVDKLISEFYSYPGALPLLSFTLSEWYRMYIKSGRADRKLNEEDFKKMKGGFGALNNRANEIFKKLEKSQKKILTKIMLRLVSMEGDEPAGKKASMDELNFSNEEYPVVKKTIDKIVKTRLLVKSRDNDGITYVQPAHDALIRSWTICTKWRDHYGKDNIMLLHKLEAAAKEHNNLIKLGKIKESLGLLWNNDHRLDWAINQSNNQIAPLNILEKDFIQDSFIHKKRKKNRTLIISISVIIALSIFLVIALLENARASNEARIATVNYLITQAQLHVKNDPLKAILLAKEAYRLENKPLVKRVLSDAAAESIDRPFYRSKMQHHDQLAINHAEFSPSGDRVLTASQDGSARIWDLDGNLIKTFNHNNNIHSARFSPDGHTILTASSDGIAKLWNIDGHQLTLYQGHNDEVYDALFSPDGSKILTFSRDNSAKLWTRKGLLLASCSHLKDVTRAVFAPNGKSFLTITEDFFLRLWDIKGVELEKVEKVNSACFVPGHADLLCMSSPSGVILLNVLNKKKKTFIQYKKIINFIVVSPDGHNVLIVYYNGELSLWNTQNNSNLTFEQSHSNTIESACFSPDSNRILTASKDNTARLWNLRGRSIAIFQGHTDIIGCAEFSPNGNQILTASYDHTARIWELKNRLTSVFDEHDDRIVDCDFSPEGERIVTASYDQSARVWNLEGKQIALLKGHTGILNSAVFSPDGTRIVTASADHRAIIWNLKRQSNIKLMGHQANVNSAIFSPSGNKVLTSSDDHTAILWNLYGLRLNKETIVHSKIITSAVFSPDEKSILTASHDHTAILWDLEGNRKSVFSEHIGIIYSAVFSPDGLHVLTASEDGTALLSDLQGKVLAMYKHRSNVNSAIYSPDGQYILTVSFDFSAVLWTLEGKPVSRFLGHTNIIHSAMFSPDGMYIVTSSDDNTVKLWHIDGDLMASFNKHKAAVWNASFAPDGKRIISVSSDKTARLWHTPDAIIAWLKTAKLPSVSLDMDRGTIKLK